MDFFKGAFTALITPFKNGQIDEEKYREHIEWQIEKGIHGLVPCGTTGESATMSHDEHKRVIKICVEQVKGRVPVIAGTGSNNTKEAIELTAFAKEAGVDGALVITPYYNKPTPQGLLLHYKEIAKAAPIPIVVYNVPGRTGTNLLPETLYEIKKNVPEVIGVKEASGNIRQASDILELCGEDFIVLSGDDFITFPMLSIGGRGVISVVSNIVPDKMASLCNSFFDGNIEGARRLHYELAPLCRAMFFETNPIPVKTSLHLMGRIEMELRLPLCEMKPENRQKLESVLKKAGLI
ncbi:4-hydroxy-tetrahydrodipicolinate synthase [Desulfothermus okinawensis JCM 13304]